MARGREASKEPPEFTYAQRQRLLELEGSLFGRGTAALEDLGKEEERNARFLPAVDLLANGDGRSEEASHDPLIIWEDRRGAAEPLEFSDDEASDEGRPGGVPDSVDGKDLTRTRPIAASDNDEEAAPAIRSWAEREKEANYTDSEAPAAPEDEEETGGDGSDSLLRGAKEIETALQERRATGAAAEASKRKAVWEDLDDDLVQVNIAQQGRLRKLRQAETDTTVSGREYAARLQKQHAKLNPNTSWATLGEGRKRRKKGAEDGSDAEEDDKLERLVQGAEPLLGRRSVLPAGLLETTRVKDANHQEPSKAVVQSVEFHPGGQLLLTAGLDKTLRFFQVDGVKNPKLQSVFLEDLPIHKAAFANGGSQVIASGRRKHFYVFDLQAARVERIAGLTGRSEKSLEDFAVSPTAGSPLVAFLGARGYVPLFSLKSRQSVAQLKMPGSIRSAAFSHDGLQLLASGGDGVIHTWDMRTRRCLGRLVDEGTLRGTALALSPDDSLLAAGSDAGVVNVYSRDKAALAGMMDDDARPLAAAVPRPIKTLMNLTTAIDNLSFSPDGQILAMASKQKKDSLRLVHTSSMTVFSNWPTSRTPLGFVHSLAFSPHGGFLAVGNAKGRVLMYRMHHYSQT